MERCLGCMNEFDPSFNVCPHCGYVRGTAGKSKNHLQPGTILIDRYLIGRCLGQGGFGITYIAWDQRLYKKVAIKEFMPTSLASRITGQTDITCYNDEAQARFQNGICRMLDESRRLARFNDLESVVKVYDCFEANGTAYIIMELLDGENAKTILEQQNKIEPAQVVRIMLPVLQALREIHASGLIHRDISPDNIFVCKNGKVKLLDFGSARVASGSDEKSLSVILKPGYAPKEQYSASAPQGPYTDVYAVCATIYKMLTGITPIDSLERREQNDKLEPIETLVAVPKCLSQVIGQGLAIEADERLQTLDPLLDVFRSLDADADGDPARKLPNTPKAPKKAKHNKAKKRGKSRIKAVAACAAILLASGAAVWFAGNYFGWWSSPVYDAEPQVQEYTPAQQELLALAYAETAPTDMLPLADDRIAWEQTYGSSREYTADAGNLYADFRNEDGCIVLHEQILLPENGTDAFTMFTYTEDGKPETVVQYASDGSILSASCDYYNEDGTLFAQSVYEGETRDYTQIFTAYDDEDVAASVLEYSDGTTLNVTYKYTGNTKIEKRIDENGHKIYERMEYAESRKTVTKAFDEDDDDSPRQEITEKTDAGGRVEECIQEEYGLQKSRYKWKYDAKGRLTEHTALGEDDVPVSAIAFAYAQDGGLKTVTQKEPSNTGKLMPKCKFDLTNGSYIMYTYNDDGDLTLVETYSAYEQLKSRIEKEYDAEGHLLCQNHTDENGELTKRLEFDYWNSAEDCRYTEYDADDVRVKTVEIDKTSKPTSEKTWLYDTDGSREISFEEKEDGVIIRTTETSYSGSRKTVAETRFDPETEDETTERTEYRDDSPVKVEVYKNGDPVKEKSYESGSLQEVILYRGGREVERYWVDTVGIGLIEAIFTNNSSGRAVRASIDRNEMSAKYDRWES